MPIKSAIKKTRTALTRAKPNPARGEKFRQAGISAMRDISTVTPTRRRAAIKAFEKGALEGDAVSHYLLGIEKTGGFNSGVWSGRGDFQLDTKAGVRHFKYAAKKGHPNAALFAGEAYHAGIGVRANERLARKYFNDTINLHESGNHTALTTARYFAANASDAKKHLRRLDKGLPLDIGLMVPAGQSRNKQVASPLLAPKKTRRK